jgi:D-alanyl-D-alanine-carboxypeptidase/D-alanyl-D-alanine-endopeptidase
VFVGSQTVVHATGPVSGESVFQIWSVTKVFTALALADAATRGELDLDTPLAACLPGTLIPGPITLGHLATHTSGLPRLPPGLLRRALRHRADPYRDGTTEYLLETLAATRLRAEPGTRIRYCNFGAALLGQALSRHTSQPYAHLIAQRIPGPLAMPDTAGDLRPDQEVRKATGRSRRGRAVPEWHLGAMPGAGALYSTVPDLLTFLRAHLRPAGNALPDALPLVQQSRVRRNRWLQVGLGWFLSPVRSSGHTALWHNSGTGGFASYVALLPAAEASVLVLADTARSVDRLGVRRLSTLAESACPAHDRRHGPPVWPAAQPMSSGTCGAPGSMTPSNRGLPEAPWTGRTPHHPPEATRVHP